MLRVEIDRPNRLAVLTPEGPLQESDFVAAAAQIDPVIAESGKLNGLIIHALNFPGWDSFGAMVNHLRFVKDHHQQVKRIALVTDSKLADFAETVASHFVAAQIRNFDYAAFDDAKRWIIAGSDAEAS
ncbi:SpoIIAA family protein [Neorhodopirellula lusitana]|uniref:STAS/SEC14 domain-containing protein n=1 Tax=Neorhodopirellula lusitana TaxID=445327 RepID=UPI0038514F57